MRVLGDAPNRKATFTVEIETDLGLFHANVRENGTLCTVFQHPWKEGNIHYRCPFAIGEIVEMQVQLRPLGLPHTIRLRKVWVWDEDTGRDYDSYVGPEIEIPNLRNFGPANETDAQNTLESLNRVYSWAQTLSNVRSVKMLEVINRLIRLYEEKRYGRVVTLGSICLGNPLEIKLNGRQSDLEGFTPVLTDKENDVTAGAPLGSDLKAAYAFADLSNLYILVRVFGDGPNRKATFTVAITTDLGTFHVNVRENGTLCTVFQHPWKEGNIRFNCTFALGEIVEMQVPLHRLGSPKTIYLKNLWIWDEDKKQDFDAYDGREVEIPSVSGFYEKRETARTQSTTIVYTAVISVLAILAIGGLLGRSRLRQHKQTQHEYHRKA